MKGITKMRAILLVIALLVGLMTGCGDNAESTGSSAAQSAVSSTTEPTIAPSESADTASPNEGSVLEDMESTEEISVENSVVLPLTEEAVTFTMWDTFNPQVLPIVGGWNGHPIIQKLCKDMNVFLDATCVPGNEGSDNFALLVAAGDYPDLLSSISNMYNGGLDQAINDEVIIDLTDYIEEYAPNYLAAVESVGASKDIVTNEGYMGAFYNVVYNGYTDKGTLINKTALDELGMDIPSTYDELHEALLGMKSMGMDSPLWVNYYGIGQAQTLSAGYDIAATYDAMSGSMPIFVENGEVQFSWTHDRFREFLTMMNEWYNDGLIWTDFMSDGEVLHVATSNAISKVYSGDMGCFYAGVDFIDTLAEEGYEYVGLPEVTRQEGDMIHTIPANQSSVNARFSITTECSNPELATQFFNYFYTTEAAELCDYGFEGEAFNWEDGQRVYTELLLANPDGLSSGNARRVYCVDDWCYYQNKGRDLLLYSDASIAATEAFVSNQDYTMALPTGMTLTSEESAQFSQEFNNISTYALGKIASFVMGEESIEDGWDEYLETMESLGASKVSEIYQTAYDRYMAK